MTTFNGSNGGDIANAAIGQLDGFTGGGLAELGDGLGDVFLGGDGEDYVFAANANDIIEGGEGHDRLNGGEGNDRIFGYTQFDHAGSLIGDEIVGNLGDDDLFGSNGNDVIDGGSGSDDLTGLGGNDLLYGGDDNDFLDGGAGADVINGANGSDILAFFNADDVLPGEVIDGGAGVDTITVFGNVTFANAAGIAGIEQVALFDGATASFSALQVKTGSPTSLLIRSANTGFVETFRVEMRTETVLHVADLVFANWEQIDRIEIVGDADGEFITGTVGFDRLFGNGGDDTLIGNGGVDQLFGGLGNDIYLVDQTSGEVVEAAGQGNDTVLAFLSHSLAANVEKLTLLETSHINGTGNTLNNIITGNKFNNTLSGGLGTDTLIGGLGNDTYVLENGTDTVSDSGGIDTATSTISRSLAAGGLTVVERLTLTGSANIKGTGNTLNNVITGNNANNALSGGSGNDTLLGGNGNDFLYGGAGNDRLTGGTGNDHFVFNAAISAASNVDTITDFNVANDTIRLDNAVMSALGIAMEAGEFWKSTSGAAHDSSDNIIYETDTGWLNYDSNGSAAGGAAPIAKLAPNLALTAADFLVI